MSTPQWIEITPGPTGPTAPRLPWRWGTSTRSTPVIDGLGRTTDFVNIVEAPDNVTIARASAELASRGSIKIQTLAAIPIDEFIAAFE